VRAPGAAARRWIGGAVLVALVIAFVAYEKNRDDATAADEPPPVTADPTFAAPPTVGREQSWDDVETDETPFTADALLPERFTDDRSVDYVLVTSAVRDCEEFCERMLTATYLDTTPNPVLVSVTVMPLTSATHAVVTHAEISGNDAEWSTSPVWCTEAGPGSAPCSGGVRNRYITFNHRYLVDAVAVRTDHTTDPAVTPSLVSASKAASEAGGPQNY
jgi:hypothetical protein